MQDPHELYQQYLVGAIDDPDITPDYDALAAAVRDNPHDDEATRALLEANKRLIVYIARKLPTSSSWTPDDWQEVHAVANAALWRAAQLYQPGRGRWSTYASSAILRELRKWMHNTGHPIRTAYNNMAARSKIKAAIADGHNDVGTISAATGYAPWLVRAVLATSDVLSLDDPISHTEPDGAALAEVIGGVDDDLSSADSRIDHQRLVSRILDAASPPLDEREHKFMRLWLSGYRVRDAWLAAAGQRVSLATALNHKARIIKRLRVAARRLQIDVSRDLYWSDN